MEDAASVCAWVPHLGYCSPTLGNQAPSGFPALLPSFLPPYYFPTFFLPLPSYFPTFSSPPPSLRNSSDKGACKLAITTESLQLNRKRFLINFHKYKYHNEARREAKLSRYVNTRGKGSHGSTCFPGPTNWTLSAPRVDLSAPVWLSWHTQRHGTAQTRRAHASPASEHLLSFLAANFFLLQCCCFFCKKQQQEDAATCCHVLEQLHCNRHLFFLCSILFLLLLLLASHSQAPNPCPRSTGSKSRLQRVAASATGHA